MPSPQGTLVLSLVSSVASSEVYGAATPVGKVAQMLKDMVTKGEAEKKDEEVKYAAFAQWCSDGTSAKHAEIQASDDSIELLKAKIQKADARVRTLTERVQDLDLDVDRWHKESQDASDVRAKEKADYQATASDYAESISAIGRAIDVLQKQAYDRSQAQDALLQVTTSGLVPLVMKKALGALLQKVRMPDDELAYEAPEANAYDFQSGGVLDMLAKLKNDFQAKKRDLDSEEMHAQHAYDLVVQTLSDNIENAQHEISKKTTGKEETAQARAEAQGNLDQTITDRAEDAQYLADMTAMCGHKKADFEKRQALRAGELDALRKAIEIISSEDVNGAAEKNLPAMLQMRHGSHSKALAQLRASSHNPVQDRLSLFLRQRADSCNSQLLTLVSQRVATDPFEKVKKMIKDLISKLMQEATAETEHKGWCDTELAANKLTRAAKSEEVDKLAADVDDLTAQIAQLSQDISDLGKALSELAASVAEATSDRAEAKAANAQTINEAKQAQSAVTQAIGVLKEYYAKSADNEDTVAVSFVQQHGKKRQTPEMDAPETWSTGFKGQLPESGSVVDFLEVILSDFARLESETSTAESVEQDQHEKFMFESDKDKALKENEQEHKRRQKTNKESDLHSTENELRSAREQLDKANTYYDKLKPSCLDTGISYEERVKRRESEIQSLQEALQILTGQDIAA